MLGHLQCSVCHPVLGMHHLSVFCPRAVALSAVLVTYSDIGQLTVELA